MLFYSRHTWNPSLDAISFKFYRRIQEFDAIVKLNSSFILNKWLLINKEIKIRCSRVFICKSEVLNLPYSWWLSCTYFHLMWRIEKTSQININNKASFAWSKFVLRFYNYIHLLHCNNKCVILVPNNHHVASYFYEIVIFFFIISLSELHFMES